MGGTEGWGVVHTITGHGDDLSSLLGVVTNDELVLWRHAGEDNLLVREPEVPLGTLLLLAELHDVSDVISLDHNGLALRLIDDSDLLGDGLGGDGVVPGHHEDLDSSTLALAHGLWHSDPWGVNQSEESREGQVVHREVGLRLGGVLLVLWLVGHVPVRESQDSLSEASQGFVGVLELLLPLRGELHLLAVDADGLAHPDHPLRGALEHHDAVHAESLLHVVDAAHPLVGGVELDLEDLWVGLPELLDVPNRLQGLDQSSLTGITAAVDVKHVVVVLQPALSHWGWVLLADKELGVVAHGSDGVQDLEGWVLGVVHLALGVVAHLVVLLLVPGGRHIKNLVVVPGVLHSHTVLGESSRLIGSDDGGTAESLDGLQVLHEHLPVAHSLGGKGQRDGHGGEKALWHVGHDDTDGEDDVLDEGRLSETDSEQGHAKGDRDGRDKQDELPDLLVDWRTLLLLPGGQVSDLTHGGVVANSDDDTHASSGADDGTVESDVLGFHDWWGLSVHLLLDLSRTLLWLSLTGKTGIVDVKLVGADDSDVRRDLVSLVELHEVSLDHLRCVNDLRASGTDHLGLPWDHVLEAFHDAVTLRFLVETERASDKDDGTEDDTEVQVDFILLRVNAETNEAQDATGEKQEREEVRELLQEFDPQGRLLGRSQLVLSVLIPVEHNLVGRKAHLRGRVVKLRDTLYFPSVLRQLHVRGQLVRGLRLLALVP
mmetsp:Transcript_9745/g.27748  ORF Transcript_9745/g.27748 Transcript_9745/m.27748 type:complete len:714 (+) Transcript_9745:2219-4360(+)